MTRRADPETRRRVCRGRAARARGRRSTASSCTPPTAIYSRSSSARRSTIATTTTAARCENRARFVLEIVAAIRAEVGSDFHLQMKISADEYNDALARRREAGQHARGVRRGVQVARGRRRRRDPRLVRELLPPSTQPGRRLCRRRARKTYDKLLSSGSPDPAQLPVVPRQPTQRLFERRWEKARGDSRIEGINLPAAQGDQGGGRHAGAVHGRLPDRDSHPRGDGRAASAMR